MSSEFQITYRDEFVEVITSGEKNIQLATKLWTAVVAECEQHSCYNVLGISEAENPMPTIDGYQHADLFTRLNIDHRYRIAWVERNPEALNATYFVETVLINRGLPGRLFTSVGAARDWLLNDGKKAG